MCNKGGGRAEVRVVGVVCVPRTPRPWCMFLESPEKLRADQWAQYFTRNLQEISKHGSLL